MYVCMHACMLYVGMYACMYECMYVCMYVYESTGNRQNPQTIKLQAPFCGRSHKGRCCMPPYSPQTEPCSPQTAGASLRPQPQWQVCILTIQSADSARAVRRLRQPACGRSRSGRCIYPDYSPQTEPGQSADCGNLQPQWQVPSPQRSPRNHKVTLSLPKTANVYVHTYVYIYIYISYHIYIYIDRILTLYLSD